MATDTLTRPSGAVFTGRLSFSGTVSACPIASPTEPVQNATAGMPPPVWFSSLCMTACIRFERENLLVIFITSSLPQASLDPWNDHIA